MAQQIPTADAKYHVPDARPASLPLILALLTTMFVLAAVLFNAVIAFMMAGRWGFIIYGPPVALARQTAWFARPDRWLVLIGCAAASFYYVWMAFKGKGSRWPLLIAILNLVSLLIFDGLVGDSIRNP